MNKCLFKVNIICTKTKYFHALKQSTILVTKKETIENIDEPEVTNERFTYNFVLVKTAFLDKSSLVFALLKY